MTKFKDYLEEHGVSGYQISKEIGMTQQAISKLTSGKQDVSGLQLINAKRIADYLGISLEELLKLSDKNL